jgi:hypothetical protein
MDRVSWSPPTSADGIVRMEIPAEQERQRTMLNALDLAGGISMSQGEGLVVLGKRHGVSEKQRGRWASGEEGRNQTAVRSDLSFFCGYN